MMPLSIEHQVKLDSEFRSGDEMTWNEYRENEEKIEEEFMSKIAAHKFRQLNRHAPNGRNNASTHVRNYNRSFSLRPQSMRGSAVLVHGLTDSPYSMRSTAAILERQGFATYVPRLPGHGFAVGALRHPDWQDWMAVVTMAMKEADAAREAGQPLILGGYSNGGILSLKYAIECQQDDGQVCPDAILLLSPAIKISAFALFAKLNGLVSWLPYFEQFQWESIYPEIDPYKFTSFPKSPGWETAQLAWSVEDAVAGGDVQLPPVLAFQSAVDATVNARALLTLFGKLRANDHRLVFYDINRTEAISDLVTVEKLNLDKLEEDAPYEFSVDILSNIGTGSKAVEKLRLVEGQIQLEQNAMEVTWPGGIYSLSHIAIPFSPEDPVYGVNGSSVGAHSPRGERKVLYLSPDYFLRLRYNPFFEWQKAQIETWLQSIIQSM
jgi:alpha-beta hydrolase superfamily lysophospholipase